MNTNKCIAILRKERSRKEIHFEIDEKMSSDGWFISVKTIQTGKITTENCIIRKDLERWLQSFYNEGWYNILKDNRII